MLDTWNDHNFDTRFGAFVFDDKLRWRVDNISRAANLLLDGYTPDGTNLQSANSSELRKTLEDLFKGVENSNFQVSVTELLADAGVTSVGPMSGEFSIPVNQRQMQDIFGTPRQFLGNASRSPIFQFMTNRADVNSVVNGIDEWIKANAPGGSPTVNVSDAATVTAIIDAAEGIEEFFNSTVANALNSSGVVTDNQWSNKLPFNVSFDSMSVDKTSKQIRFTDMMATGHVFSQQANIIDAPAIVINFGDVIYQEAVGGANANVRFVDGTNITIGSEVVSKRGPYTMTLAEGNALTKELIIDFLVSDTGRADVESWLRGLPNAVIVNSSSPLTILHNSSAPHALPAFIGEMTRAQFRALTGQKDAQYVTRNEPLPLSVRQQARVDLILSVVASLLLLIPFCYIPASFAVFIVKERTCKSKHLQMVSGVSASSYWGAHYVFDMALYTVLMVWAIIVFEVYGNAIFMADGESRAATISLFFMYGLSSIPLCYVYSFLFSNHSNSRSGEDGDVTDERRICADLVTKGVDTGSTRRGEQPIVIIDELRKRYATREPRKCRTMISAPCADTPADARPRLGKLAVQGLSLQIPQGQCFGFLGVNGAGKTTTLSMLTGEIEPTSGNAWVAGHDIISSMAEVKRNVGYCPQFDPLLDLMSGRETIRMFALLKGVPKSEVGQVVEKYVNVVGLQKFASRPAGSYSGGNKRKLSLAVALVGKPGVVMLDEPSSGMDPGARRQMWDIISSQSRDRCFILTTHAMDEAEALCGRIGIMVNGAFVCLGSAQHLKMKYGTNYEAEFKLLPGEDDDASRQRVGALRTFMKDAFPGCMMDEQHGLHLKVSDMARRLLRADTL
eukprot:g712.t1